MPNRADQITLVPNAPAVVSETIAGESIIMHHGTGHYFDTVGTGTTLWEAVVGGATRETMARLLAARHGVTAEIADAAAERFVATLAQHDLIRTDSAPPSASNFAWEAVIAEPFQEPVLGVHTDLADMLLLDPIHDVGEAGWPSPPPLAVP